MKKTIDFDNLDIKVIEEYSKENKNTSFSEAVRSMIRNFNTTTISDENFALIADALVEISAKIDVLLINIQPPKNAGEVKN